MNSRIQQVSAGKVTLEAHAFSDGGQAELSAYTKPEAARAVAHAASMAFCDNTDKLGSLRVAWKMLPMQHADATLLLPTLEFCPGKNTVPGIVLSGERGPSAILVSSDGLARLTGSEVKSSGFALVDMTGTLVREGIQSPLLPALPGK